MSMVCEGQGHNGTVPPYGTTLQHRQSTNTKQLDLLIVVSKWQGPLGTRSFHHKSDKLLSSGQL